LKSNNLSMLWWSTTLGKLFRFVLQFNLYIVILKNKFDMSTLNNFPKIHFGILNFIFQKQILHYRIIYILNLNKINIHFSSILMHTIIYCINFYFFYVPSHRLLLTKVQYVIETKLFPWFYGNKYANCFHLVSNIYI
jgi:hypothetical protein